MTAHGIFNINQIENMDLIVIMGNLMDNAIEAAENVQDGFLKIYLYTQNNAHFSVIKVINNYIQEIEEDRGILLTIKEDKGKHGFGIKNIKAVTEKYNGYFECFYQNKIFTAVVIIPNKEYE